MLHNAHNAQVLLEFVMMVAIMEMVKINKNVLQWTMTQVIVLNVNAIGLSTLIVILFMS